MRFFSCLQHVWIKSRKKTHSFAPHFEWRRETRVCSDFWFCFHMLHPDPRHIRMTPTDSRPLIKAGNFAVLLDGIYVVILIVFESWCAVVYNEGYQPLGFLFDKCGRHGCGVVRWVSSISTINSVSSSPHPISFLIVFFFEAAILLLRGEKLSCRLILLP